MANWSNVTKYAGAFEYDGNNKVTRIAITDGQALNYTGYITFQYYHKDHLGHVRNVIDEFGNTNKEQTIILLV